MALEPLSLGALRIGSKSRRKKSQDLTDEDYESLLSRVGGQVGSGLQYVGETLDKPGRALRGVLAGKTHELANLIPFSDTMGLTDPEKSVSGRDLLEKAGVLRKNKEGLDLGDVAGFGLEVLADPMNLVVGPGKAAAKGFSLLKPTKTVHKAFTSLDALTDAAKAAGGIKGGNTSQALSNFGQLAAIKSRDADFALQRLVRAARKANAPLKNHTDEEILSLVTKKKPPVAVDYNLLDDYRAAKKAADTAAQGHTDLAKALNPASSVTTAEVKYPGVSPSRIVEEIGRGDRGLVGLQLPAPLRAIGSAILGRPVGSEPLAILGTGKGAAKLAESAYYSAPSRYVRNLLDHRVEGAGVNKVAQQLADKAYAARFDELAHAQEHMVEIGRRLPQVEKLWGEMHQAYPTLQPKTFSDAMRDAAEAKSMTYMQDIAKSVNASPDMLQKAMEFDKLAGQITGLQNTAYNHALSMGMKGGHLDDVVAHSYRKVNPALLKTKRGQDLAQGPNSFGGTVRRKDPLRGVSTTTINRASSDPAITATGDFSKAALDAAEQKLHQDYGFPLSVQVKGPNGTGNYRQARAMARVLAGLPKEVVTSGGMFPRTTAMDAMEYLQGLTKVRGGLMAMHDMIHKFADPSEAGPTVTQLFKQLGLTTNGDNSGLANWAKQYALNTGKQINPDDLRVPQALADGANRMMHYNIKPEKVEGLLKLFDKYTGFMKGALTVPFAAFHMRNLLSGLWQNSVTAFDHPAHAKASILSAIDALLGRNPDLLNELRIYDILPMGAQRVTDTFNSATHSIKPDEMVSRVFNPMVPLRRAKANYQAGKGTGVKGMTASLVGGAKDASGERSGGLFTWGKDATTMVEFLNRASHYAARRSNGWSPAMAARSTKLAHFDYGDLSLFEKRGMKRLFPFYTWSRKNLPLQLRELINSPGGPTSRTVRGMLNLRREGGAEGPGGQGWLPARLGESTAFQWPFGEQDPRDRKFFAENALLPVSEAFNRYPTSGGHLDAKLGFENVMGMAHPFAQMAYQTVTGRQPWSHRDAKDLYQWPTDWAPANEAIAQSPLSRAATLARTLGDSRKSLSEKAVNALLGGVRVTDVDLQKELLQHLRNGLEKGLEGQRGIGEFTRRYVSNPEKISPQALQDMEALNRVQKESSELRKADEASGRAKPRPKPPKKKKKAENR